MKTTEFTATIDFADTETDVVVEVEYDDLGPTETRVFIPCPHKGCKKHRLEISSIVTEEEWEVITARIPQEILMAETER